MRLIRNLLLSFIVVIAIFVFAANTLASGQITAPTTRYTFTPVAKSSMFTVDMDQSTRHETIDEDGDTLIGGVFRVTLANPVVGGTPRKTVGTFIYALLAVCGHDGLVILQSNLYDPLGKHVQLVDTMEAVSVKSEASPTAVIYTHLCTGYRSKSSNKVNWT